MRGRLPWRLFCLAWGRRLLFWLPLFVRMRGRLPWLFFPLTRLSGLLYWRLLFVRMRGRLPWRLFCLARRRGLLLWLLLFWLLRPLMAVGEAAIRYCGVPPLLWGQPGAEQRVGQAARAPRALGPSHTPFPDSLGNVATGCWSRRIAAYWFGSSHSLRTDDSGSRRQCVSSSCPATVPASARRKAAQNRVGRSWSNLHPGGSPPLGCYISNPHIWLGWHCGRVPGTVYG